LGLPARSPPTDSSLRRTGRFGEGRAEPITVKLERLNRDNLVPWLSKKVTQIMMPGNSKVTERGSSWKGRGRKRSKGWPLGTSSGPTLSICN